jgi:hypothetical protein
MLSGDKVDRIIYKVHGGGLDTKPTVMVSKNRYTIKWEWHLMTDNGFYDGYWFFKVHIPINDPMDFTLRGVKGNTRRNSTIGVKDYLVELFIEAIRGEGF